jgi:hypothetical protein
VDATFAAFGIDAVYTPVGGVPVPVRVIARRPDTIVGFGETRIHAETATFEVRTSEVVSPRSGDQLTVGGETFIVQGDQPGLPLDGLPELSAEGERDGFYQAQLIRELAVRHITSWTGVGLEGGPAPPTPENIGAVMELYPVGERFFQEFTLRQVLLNAAKNGSGPSAAGTSSKAEGPNTAKPAATTTCPAPEESPEPTDGSARTASTP